MDDNGIIDLLKTLRELGIIELQRTYGSLIRYVISGILRDSRDIDECVNDVYLKAADKIESYSEGKASFSSWLTAIARNAAIDRLRASKLDTVPLDDDISFHSTPEDEAIKNERRIALRRAIKSLGDTERRLIYRKYFYLQSTAQIASEMGLTEKGVESRLYRIRKKLQKLLGGDFDE